MIKLNKPKAFEASESILVNFQGKEVEVANLKRSALVVQSCILVANNGVWIEVDVALLTIQKENKEDNIVLDSVFLPSVKNHIETNGITLGCLGIIQEKEEVDYSLDHDDFMQLEKEFPTFDYIQIGKLHAYELKSGDSTIGMYHKRQTLAMLQKKGLTIQQYIDQRENPIPISETEVISVVLEPELNNFSIAIFESIQPNALSEVVSLKKEQEQIALDNPVITITDKATYDKAKKNAAVLLSASTKVDGKTGIFANGKKLINTFKSEFDNTGVEIAGITRNPYNDQITLIKAWDNRILLETQRRVKLLFEVPFVFDSENYTIGSITVTNKQIESLSNENFEKIVEQGRAVKIAMEALKTQQDEKILAQEKQIEELKAMVAQLMPKQTVTAEQIKNTPFPDNKYINTITGVPAKKDPDTLPWDTQEVTEQQKPVTVYQLPNPENKLLNALDLEHFEVIEETQYLQCRSFYAQAMSDCAKELQAVFDNPDQTITKSVEIKKLIALWKLQ